MYNQSGSLQDCVTRKLRQGKPRQTLFNMALAMLAAWVIFLAGFTRTESEVGCVAVAALLHYFILASFMWMSMEGVLQYLLLVRVQMAHFPRYFMLKTVMAAWGKAEIFLLQWSL
jgi:hypothetical protein